jgi:hypothetical protein
VGDVDGDGMDDVVWRDAASGRNEIWRGADAASQIPLATVANPAWKIVAVDDFDYQDFDALDAPFTVRACCPRFSPRCLAQSRECARTPGMSPPATPCRQDVETPTPLKRRTDDLLVELGRDVDAAMRDAVVVRRRRCKRSARLSAGDASRRGCMEIAES